MLRGRDFLEMSDEDLIERIGDKMLYGEQAKAALARRNARRVAEALDGAAAKIDEGLRVVAQAEVRFRESVSEAAESASRAIRMLMVLTIVLVVTALALMYASWRLQMETKALRFPSYEPQGLSGVSADGAE